MWAIECVKFFDVYIYMALSPIHFPVSFVGNRGSQSLSVVGDGGWAGGTIWGVWGL